MAGDAFGVYYTIFVVDLYVNGLIRRRASNGPGSNGLASSRLASNRLTGGHTLLL